MKILREEQVGAGSQDISIDAVEKYTSSDAVKDFGKGFLNGLKKELLGYEGFETWLDNHGFKVDKNYESKDKSNEEDTENNPDKWSTRYTAKANNNDIVLSINENNNHIMYFMVNKIVMPADNMNIVFNNFGNSDLRTLTSFAKSIKCELIQTIDDKAYSSMKKDLDSVDVNIFNSFPKDNRFNNYNNDMLRGNTNSYFMNSIIVTAGANSLNNSNLSDDKVIDFVNRITGDNVNNRIQACQAFGNHYRR